DYAGADWFGRRKKAKDGDKPPAPWWPEDGPDAGRYWHLDESDKIPVQGWRHRDRQTPRPRPLAAEAGRRLSAA
ncbi:hypothetical protein KXS07_24485, partial [Inquilinus limosus]|uniref:hypothetical protein n=1 Tax=Inquilinus limosus TaxID=171674 RepID=UPI003F13D9CF